MRTCLRPSLLATALLLGGCSGEETTKPPAPPAPRAWQRLATPSKESLGSIRGFTQARGIIHSHSPYSHDACDGDGLPNGAPNATCLAHLRLAICEAAEDFVMLTDHGAHMAEYDYEKLLHIQPGDDPVMGSNGTPIANRVPCGDGRKVLLMAGNENSLMSAGLERHLPGDAAARLMAYDGEDKATVDAMHEAGALVFVAHTEQRTNEFLSGLPIDGFEIYNLHAAVDPDIRKDYLGLESLGGGAAILPFTRQDEDGPQPDMAFLGFFEELPIYTKKWDELLPLRHFTGTAGTDVHENSLPGMMRDGERGDSYRRLMRWFSNVALVSGDVDPTNVKAALKEGRSYVAFEILGVPGGFDFHAEYEGTTIEMGGQTKAGATIVATAPLVWNLDPAVTPPTISMRLVHVFGGKSETAVEGPVIRLDSAPAGIYRVEVRITPHHLRPYLGDMGDQYVTERLWILSNPIRVL